MAFTANFTTSQNLGFPSRITFADTSQGTVDPLVVARRIYLLDASGNYIVVSGTTTQYELWSIALATINISPLLIDKALSVRVDWVDVGGNALYTKTVLTLYPLYAKTYYIALIKSQSSRPRLIDHANFYVNEIKLLCSIQEATNAVDLAGDIASAQAALTRAKQLVDKPSYFF